MQSKLQSSDMKQDSAKIRDNLKFIKQLQQIELLTFTLEQTLIVNSLFVYFVIVIHTKCALIV